MMRPLASQLFVLAALSLLSVLPASPCTAEVIRSVKHVDTTYLLLPDVARYYGMNLRTSGRRMELLSRYSRLVFQKDKREMVLNDVPVHQSFAPSIWRGYPVISNSDFHEILEPVLRRASLPRQKVRRIVLDPGHGGRDPGAIGDRVEEKDIVLALAVRTRRRLLQYGYDVVLTRSGDEFLALSERSERANQVRADVFVSFHINAVDNAGVRGIETFALTPPGTPSTYGSRRTTDPAKGDDYIRHSMCLGYEIQRQLIENTRAEDRGVRRANFAVLRETAAPAVLIEAGFLTNRTEERRLMSAEYQERIAAAVVEGIRRYAKAVDPDSQS